MCGIVGAVSNRNIVPVLVEGLKRLEYRGYDSCGVAVHRGGQLQRTRSTSRRTRRKAVAGETCAASARAWLAREASACSRSSRRRSMASSGSTESIWFIHRIIMKLSFTTQ